MRFTVGATAVFAAAIAHAQEEAEAAPSSVSVSKPTFTPTTLKAPFLEQFTDDWESRWKPSSAKKDTKGDDEEWAYVGTWSVEEPSVLKGIEGDKGLVIKDKAAHHAISSKFAKAVDNTDNTLVVQYEVKLQNGLECGGAYMKLLQNNAGLHAEEFANSSPYVIMFGPDKCGATNKVHFIFRHKNPKTGEYEEKHLNTPPTARIVKTSTLYTLVVRPDQSFEIKIDGESTRNGTLLEDFTPSVNPEAEIDDAEDKKPEEWVDEARIADPEASKPEDWDDDAPFEIVDTEAEMPADWLEDEPTTIPDPEAEKPEDWDDEEDGDWIPPTVPNPKCDEAAGCGKWEAPMTKNPAYKGKWTAPFIDNPLYKGVWAPRKIANPNYFEDKTPANFEPIGAIGFELWSMQNDILFDNIYIGHSVEDAEKLRLESFVPKHTAEKADEAANMPKPKDTPKSLQDLAFKDDPVTYVKEKVLLFTEIARRDPVEAIKAVPEVAGGLGALAVTILALLISALVGSGAAPSKEQVKAKAEKAKKASVDAKNQVAEAVAVGAEHAQAQAEANKRTTRSTVS